MRLLPSPKRWRWSSTRAEELAVANRLLFPILGLVRRAELVGSAPGFLPFLDEGRGVFAGRNTGVVSVASSTAAAAINRNHKMGGDAGEDGVAQKIERSRRVHHGVNGRREELYYLLI